MPRPAARTIAAWAATAAAAGLGGVAGGAGPALAAPPAAAPNTLGSSPLSSGLPSSPAATTASTPTAITVGSSSTATTGDSGLSGTSAVAIGIGALVVIGGIAFFIWYDANRRAPAHAAHSHRGDGEPGESVTGRRATKARPKPVRKMSAAEKRRRRRGKARR